MQTSHERHAKRRAGELAEHLMKAVGATPQPGTAAAIALAELLDSVAAFADLRSGRRPSPASRELTGAIVRSVRERSMDGTPLAVVLGEAAEHLRAGGFGLRDQEAVGVLARIARQQAPSDARPGRRR